MAKTKIALLYERLSRDDDKSKVHRQEGQSKILCKLHMGCK